MAETKTYDVQVSNIAPSTTEQSLKDFFTFCGTIHKIDFSPSAHTATLWFEKPSAAKTALMLNGGALEGSHLNVSAVSGWGSAENDHHTTSAHDEVHHEPGHVDQSDKPRAGIAAEYLAKGYNLSDQILERAIALDNQHGISQRFLTFFHSLDTTLGEKALGKDKTLSGKFNETINQAQAQVRVLDEQKGITKQAGDYYSKAFSSPFGQKVYEFYTSTTKGVSDIHDEAMRIKTTHRPSAGAGHHHGGAPSASGPAEPAPSVEISEKK